jgi:hypothetical protein
MANRAPVHVQLSVVIPVYNEGLLAEILTRVYVDGRERKIYTVERLVSRTHVPANLGPANLVSANLVPANLAVPVAPHAVTR